MSTKPTQATDETIPTISPETAAHVLWFYGRGGVQPGRFAQNLMQAIDSADRDNTETLRGAYPELVAALQLAGTDNSGVYKLQRIARGEVAA